MAKNLMRLFKENNFYEQWHLIPYSTSGITSGEKVFRELKMAVIFKIWIIKHSFNLTSD